MEEQKITIKIAGQEYVLKAPSPEYEALVRLGAESINKSINSYLTLFAGRTMVDILSFVAINECVSKLSLQRKIESLEKEADKLRSDTDLYLDNIDKSGR